jgi:ABC-type transporter Mla subunit MlaD
VYVTISFEKGYEFRAGTSAKTTEPGLGMGRPPIELFPGPESGAILATGSSVPGRIATAVESLIPAEISDQVQNVAAQLDRTAKALEPVLDDLHELLQARSPEAVDGSAIPGNLSSAMARLDSSLKHFNTVLGDPETQSKLSGAVDNLYTMTEDGKQIASEFKAATVDVRTFVRKANDLVDTTQGTMGDAKARYDEVALALMGNLAQLAGVLDDFQSMSAAMNRGEGTLGKAVRDDRLYESMVLTFQRLSGATEDLRVLLQDWQKGKIRVGL